MLEVEIKAYCDHPEKILNRIIALGAKEMSRIDERDVYFNHPSRDFAVTDEALRIRQANADLFMTYKGPKIGEKSKTRYEREIPVEDYEGLRDILLRLGFQEVLEVRKYRVIYLYKGIDICLDDVRNLGHFVELEKQGESKDEIEAELFRLADTLGLERFERRSYLEMLLALDVG